MGSLPLGVDLESIERFPDADAIAREFFSQEEYLSYCSLSPGDQPLAFTRCWTRKEAFIKAVGSGLAYPLSRFTVSLRPTEPPSLLRVDGQEDEALRWTITELATEEGYVGSLALPLRDLVVTYLRFPDDLAGMLKTTKSHNEGASRRS